MNPFITIRQFTKMLRNLDQWFEKATGYADVKKFDVDVLMQARLAPDQFSLVKQVQACCDAAKFAAAYLAGKQPPSHSDTETTMKEARARIETVLEYLETFKAEDFAGAAERRISPPWLHGKWLRGDDYLADLAIPNFYFHAVMVYAILRHNGVDLGKMDYIGSMLVRD